MCWGLRMVAQAPLGRPPGSSLHPGLSVSQRGEAWPHAGGGLRGHGIKRPAPQRPDWKGSLGSSFLRVCGPITGLCHQDLSSLAMAGDFRASHGGAWAQELLVGCTSPHLSWWCWKSDVGRTRRGRKDSLLLVPPGCSLLFPQPLRGGCTCPCRKYWELQTRKRNFH